MEQDLV